MPVFRKDERKFLFVHVPKTGGSSIERAFADAGYDTMYRDGRVGKRSWNDIRRCTPQHMHREVLEMLFRTERFDGIFMVVRDPVARLQSEYLWRHRAKDFTIDGRSVEKWAAKTFSQFRSAPYIFDNHIRPQIDFLLDRATVFRFEDGLDTVAKALNKRWDLGIAEELPRVREGHTTTNYSSRDVEVTPSLRQMLADFYGEDFEQFGYKP